MPYDEPTNPADAALLALLMHSEWERIRADKDVAPSARVDALKVALPGITEAAQACRMAMTHVEPTSHPEAVKRLALSNRAARQEHARKQSAHVARIEHHIEARVLGKIVEEAEAAVAEASAVAERMEKSGDATSRLLSQQAAVNAQRALDGAKARLAAHRRGRRP